MKNLYLISLFLLPLLGYPQHLNTSNSCQNNATNLDCGVISPICGFWQY